MRIEATTLGEAWTAIAAAILTDGLQPLTDTSYVPCVSLLDFWLVKGRLQLAVYANAIDFGTKGYANLVELAAPQSRVAGDLGAGLGTLTMTVKSAHIYQTELGLMRRIVATT